MKCIKINDVVDYMLSLDLTDFIEEKILVKEKDYVYTSMVRVTYDRTMIRCVPIQARRGGRALYDGRTIYAQATGRINSRQENISNVPQGVTMEHWVTCTLGGIDD